MASDLYDRVRMAREGSAVERCHAHEHLLRYSVGHHSLDMVTLLTLAWRAAHGGELPRAELLVAAAFHDVPERYVGDVPSTIKSMLDGRLDAIEERILKWLGADPFLTEEEAEYLLAADRIELWLWCWEEARRGNRDFLEWADHYTAHYRDNPPPGPFRELMEAVLEQGGVNKLRETQLREMFGS